MTHDEWSELLQELSRACLASIPRDIDPSPFGFGLQQLIDRYPQEGISNVAREVLARRAGYLGLPPATPAQIAREEQRLGIQLPAQYRCFLEVSNGFLLPGGAITSYLPIEQVEPLKTNYPEVAEFWRTMMDGLEEEVPDLLESRLDSTLQISGPPNDRWDFIMLDDRPESEGAELSMFNLGHNGPSDPIGMDALVRNALAYWQWKISA